MSVKTDQGILVEIDQLNTKLKKNPKNLTYVCRLASLHLDDNKISRSRPHMTNAIQLYKENMKTATLKQGMDLAETMVKFWKAEKYTNKQQEVRVNLSQERDQFLQQVHEIAKTVITKQDSENEHLLSLRMAYIKEMKGEFQAALAILSDLIAAQAMDKVDLSYIIFKAAVLLMHVGQPKQAIEYLEFIMDDPPVEDGFGKTHLCAFLVHVYEQSGEKYKVFLPKTYKELQQAFSEDMPAAYSKLMRTQAKGAQFAQTSEVWEVLAMQALDRCEYVLAGEFLSEAIAKSPGKAKLLHLLAEVYALLKQKEQARVCAEQAYEVNPQSSELRNLLLQVAPEVWADRLRHLSATTNTRSNNDGAEDGDFMGEIAEAYAPPSHSRGAKSAAEGGPGSPTPTAAPAGGGASHGVVSAPPATAAYLSAEVEPVAEENTSWLSKMKTKASGALKAIHTGAPLTANIAKKIEATKAGAEQAVTASPPGEDAAIPAPEANAGNEERTLPAQEISSPARPKSRSSFISMLLPGQAGRGGAGVSGESERGESPTRPKSRSSFISMILPSSLVPGGGASAAGQTEGISSPVRSSKSSPEKASAAPAGGSSGRIPTTSPNKGGSAPVSSKPTEVLSPPKGKEKSASKLFGGSGKKASAVKPKEKKENKYDTDLHPSRLADEAPRGSAGRPERPTITEEERRMLNLILSGNENVPVYDPNLLVLQQLRASSKRNQTV